jgi:hypothetical protein
MQTEFVTICMPPRSEDDDSQPILATVNVEHAPEAYRIVECWRAMKGLSNDVISEWDSSEILKAAQLLADEIADSIGEDPGFYKIERASDVIMIIHEAYSKIN